MTNEELKLRFFALYLGQPCRITDVDPPVPSMIEGIDFHLKKVISERVNYSPDLIQLILKPLSTITDQQVKTICRLAVDNHISKIIREPLQIRVKFKVLMMQIVIRFAGNVHGEFFEDETALEADIEIYDTLRSMGFCLPYMGKEPFAEGWAIPETT